MVQFIFLVYGAGPADAFLLPLDLLACAGHGETISYRSVSLDISRPSGTFAVFNDIFMLFFSLFLGHLLKIELVDSIVLAHSGLQGYYIYE